MMSALSSTLHRTRLNSDLNPFNSALKEIEKKLQLHHNPKYEPMGMGKLANEKACPPWLHPLLSTAFFAPCERHFNSSKSECNMYCLDCTDGAMCSSCLLYHRDHRSIQIRRSSYHDVIRASEIQKFLDISGVQTYIINGARVVFLNGRPQPRPGKGVTNTCRNCRRSLLDAFAFCSLGCKWRRMSSAAVKLHKKQRMDKHREESSNKKSECSFKNDILLACISSLTNKTKKRRKGIPLRAPLGVCL